MALRSNGPRVMMGLWISSREAVADIGFVQIAYHDIDITKFEHSALGSEFSSHAQLSAVSGRAVLQ
jgi:hypothetical protein